MDWIRLGSSTDLAGTGGVITAVSHAELEKHNKRDDCWLALRGRVYNVTRYMDFHPGGVDELMRGAGKDATALFDSVHAWVNYEQLLSKCLVGPLRTTVTINLDDKGATQKKPSTEPSPVDLSNMPPPLSDAKRSEITPRFDWIQKTADIILTFYTRALCNPGLIVECVAANAVHVNVLIESAVHTFKIKFAADVRWPCTARLTNETGKIELLFIKTEPKLWEFYGSMERSRDDEVANYEYEVGVREELTHDSCALLLQPKLKVITLTPVGYHVNVIANIDGKLRKFHRSTSQLCKSWVRGA